MDTNKGIDNYPQGAIDYADYMGSLTEIAEMRKSYQDRYESGIKASGALSVLEEVSEIITKGGNEGAVMAYVKSELYKIKRQQSTRIIKMESGRVISDSHSDT